MSDKERGPQVKLSGEYELNSVIVCELPNKLLLAIINKFMLETEDNSITLAALTSCHLTSHVLCSVATPVIFSSLELTKIEGGWWSDDGRAMVFTHRQWN